MFKEEFVAIVVIQFEPGILSKFERILMSNIKIRINLITDLTF